MTPAKFVTIQGDGIAAVCCARLLTDAGTPWQLSDSARPKVAAVLLGEQTQSLLRELFPSQPGQAELFEGFHRIQQRIVKWGPTASTVALPHAGLVAPEGELLRRLWSRTGASSPLASGQNGWHILSGRGLMSSSIDIDCGNSRTAQISSARLLPCVGQDACWVESVGSGWLFLLARGDGEASLIGVGSSTERLLDESSLVAPCIDTPLSEPKVVAASPRILQPLTTHHELACGSAAMAFDPLCGEGTGNAVREAFLATAVIQASFAGHDLPSLQSHYARRLQLGFFRHLEMCRQFYGSGGSHAFWTAACQAIDDGARTLAQAMPPESQPRYRLLDRDLIPLGVPIP